jgi:hypothetical protein
MGNTLGKMIDELSSQEKTRSEDREYLLKPHEMLRIGSVTRSIERHLGQAKEPKYKPPLRRVKSVDYLWDGHPERNWVQVSKEGVHYDRDSDLERPRATSRTESTLAKGRRRQERVDDEFPFPFPFPNSHSALRHVPWDHHREHDRRCGLLSSVARGHLRVGIRLQAMQRHNIPTRAESAQKMLK